jgi:hypothetical protein
LRSARPGISGLSQVCFPSPDLWRAGIGDVPRGRMARRNADGNGTRPSAQRPSKPGPSVAAHTPILRSGFFVMIGIPPVLFGAPGKGITDEGIERDWTIVTCVCRGVTCVPRVRIKDSEHPLSMRNVVAPSQFVTGSTLTRPFHRQFFLDSAVVL